MSQRVKTAKNSQNHKLNVTVLFEHYFRRILKLTDRANILQSIVSYLL